MHPCVYCSITSSSQEMEAIQDRYLWIDKYIKKSDIYNGILVSNKKDESLPFATTWMDLEGIMIREIRQTEKHIHHMISLICAM